MTAAPQPASSPRIALVIGATGSFGAHATLALLKHGWTVRALARDPAAARLKTGGAMPIDWIKGDAMAPVDVIAAARGARVIVHAANPPGYRNWTGTVLPMLGSVIAAARAEGARIVLPASVYNYAPDAGPRIAEPASQRPATRKGAIRVRAEEILAQASHEGVRSLVLRAGDFFGPAAPSGWPTQLVRRRGGRVTSVMAPGPVDVGHAFAYLPDLAETTARLLGREDELADFAAFHFAGHWLARGDDLAAAVRRVTGRPDIPLRRFPWPALIAAAPFVETFRELLEMRYLWRRPIGLGNARLVAFLGAEPHTPLDSAVRAMLDDLGCLGEPAPAPAPARGGLDLDAGVARA